MVLKKTKTSTINRLMLIITATMMVVTLSAQFAGGSGTANDPWQIANATHLDNVRNYLGVDHNDKYFILSSNINLGVPPWNEGQGWVPLGSFGSRFTGKFNGSNMVIDGLTIDREAATQGLFGYADDAIISNVRITNANVSALETSGILIGYSRRTNVNDCYIHGEMSGTERIGMIAGYQTESHTKRSFSNGLITASSDNSHVGGLVGYQTMNSSITDSYSNVRVRGNRQSIGGIIGTNWSGNIVRCYATGYVSGINPFTTIGGLVGQYQAGAITNSYWNVQTTGQAESAGGGSGLVTSQMLQEESFENWDFDDLWTIGFEDEDTYPYFQAQEEPNEYNYPSLLPVEDFFVYVSAHQQITVAWAAPSIGEPDGYRIYRGEGMLIATVQADATHYNDTGLLLYSRQNYFVTALYGDIESAPTSVAYATPVSNGYAGGQGTIEQPYRIRNGQQLSYIRYNPHRHYVQSERINLEDFGNWIPIGGSAAIDRFTGTFDGNGYMILNLNIQANTTFNLGLFGHIGHDDISATLKNITLDNVTLNGRRVIGSLAAVADAGSIIENCYVSNVDITSTENHLQVFVGGLVGNGVDVTITNSAVVGGTIETEGGYVGGFIGQLNSGSISYSYSTCFVEGRSNIGGFVGYARGTINNSYSKGNVTASSSEVGGFIGTAVAANIRNCYATGRMMTEDNAANIGGFAGRTVAATATNCYWNTQTTGINQSAAGTGRNTEQMTYPYDEETYEGWDFEEIWIADFQGVVNEGYPYLYWHPINQSRNPNIAGNPSPADRTEDVSVEIDSLGWTYHESIMFTDPVGFRVYMNTNGQFPPDAPFEWVPYNEGESHYSSEEILPERPLYRTTYYWKVVPTTNHPDDRTGSKDRRHNGKTTQRQNPLIRGDAQNVPVWRFTTEISPNPAPSRDPEPQNEAVEVPLDLEEISWTHTQHASYSNPVGFRVYFDVSEDFNDQSHWVQYEAGQTRYSLSEILPDSLDYGQTYYWKVVPTTDAPEQRGDSENVPVWHFTAVRVSESPTIAVNPDPDHLAEGISLGLEQVSWDYISHPGYTDPIGFRVYMNTTGAFGQQSPYIWVEFEENQISYSSTEVIPEFLEPEMTYYWRVIPTTIHPDDRTERKYRRQNEETSQRHNPLFRGDARDVPIWRFITGATDAEDETVLPLVTELNANYPNPFNPETTIDFSLAEAGEVTINVFNSRGQRVVTLISSFLEAGRHQVTWNGRDEYNSEVGSGVYFYRLQSSSYIDTKKMIIMK